MELLTGTVQVVSMALRRTKGTATPPNNPRLKAGQVIANPLGSGQDVVAVQQCDLNWTTGLRVHGNKVARELTTCR